MGVGDISARLFVVDCNHQRFKPLIVFEYQHYIFCEPIYA